MAAQEDAVTFVYDRALPTGAGSARLSERAASYVLARNYEIASVEETTGADSARLTIEYGVEISLRELDSRFGVRGISSTVCAVLGFEALALRERLVVARDALEVVSLCDDVGGHGVRYWISIERDRAVGALVVEPRSALARATLTVAQPLIDAAWSSAVDRYIDDLSHTTVVA